MQNITLPGSEWAYSEARKLMSLGYRVQFLEQFFSCPSVSSDQELSHAMNMAIIPPAPTFFDVTKLNAETYQGDDRDTQKEAVFCIAWDSRTGQRTFHSNASNAALFGMRCEEFISRASNFDLAIPLCEVDALILLVYRSVHRIRSQQPAVMFLRMYIGTARTGSLIRESLRVENDELHRVKEVRCTAVALRIPSRFMFLWGLGDFIMPSLFSTPASPLSFSKSVLFKLKSPSPTWSPLQKPFPYLVSSSATGPIPPPPPQDRVCGQ